MNYYAVAAVVFILFMLRSDSAPRGVRNNNPLNIRKNAGFSWVGEVGQDEAGFVVFDSVENGIRAAAKLIKNYDRLYSINTISEIINRWAPPSENDTQSYIAHVSRALNMPADIPISAAQYPALLTVMITHENGEQPYTQETIKKGIAAA